MKKITIINSVLIDALTNLWERSGASDEYCLIVGRH